MFTHEIKSYAHVPPPLLLLLPLLYYTIVGEMREARARCATSLKIIDSHRQTHTHKYSTYIWVQHACPQSVRASMCVTSVCPHNTALEYREWPFRLSSSSSTLQSLAMALCVSLCAFSCVCGFAGGSVRMGVDHQVWNKCISFRSGSRLKSVLFISNHKARWTITNI